MAQGTGIEPLGERLGGSLRADLVSAGAVEVVTGETRHRITFPEGSIDIAELDARPAGGVTSATIDGREVDVKSTTQILRGKLERALRHESPVRDLFDIAVAHHADPDALAEAANMLGPEQIREVQGHWKLYPRRALLILYTARKCGVDGPMDPQRPQQLPPGPASSGGNRRHAPCVRLRA